MFIKPRAFSLRLIIISVVFILLGCNENPVNDSKETRDEFDYTSWLLDVFFIFRDSLPDNPEIYYPSCKDLYESVREPWTTYFSPDEAKIFLDYLTTKTAGAGVWMDSVSSGFVIKDVTPHSPAEKAGLLKGDTIITVNNESIVGVSWEIVGNKLKGSVGDTKTLQVLRPSGTVTITVTLDEFLARSVYTDSLDTNIAYIAIDVFSSETCGDSGTFQEFTEALVNTVWAEFTILDLRNNPGGELEQCIKVTSEFISGSLELMEVTEREIDTIQWIGFTQNTVWLSENRGKAIGRKFIILTNDMTASASEIVVSSLKRFRTDIQSIGTATYGKGRGQRILSTPSEGLAKITYALIAPASGKSYDMTGITPDIVIDSTDDALTVALERIRTVTSPNRKTALSQLTLRSLNNRRLFMRKVREPLCIVRNSRKIESN